MQSCLRRETMTKPTLAFQPEAERYYADGHWRDGDLWEDFDRRVEEHPDKVALILEDREVTFAGAAPRRGRRVGQARRRRCRAGGRRHPARPPLDRGRGRDARVPAPRRRARAAAADVQRDAALRAARADRRQGPRVLRRREGDREVHGGRRRGALPARRPAGARRRARGQRPAGRPRPAPRRRPRDDPSLLRDHLGPEGHLALEQHPALRHRGRLPPLGADRARTSTSSSASSGSSAASCSATSRRCSTAPRASS